MEQQQIGGMERIGAAPPPLGELKAHPTIDDARRALSDLFGYDSFRFAQEHVIQAALDGRDTLAVMPTGAGKSICYQIPAAITEGLVLVVSPLVSLMADQVQSLKQVGIRGSFYNSTLKPHVRPEVLRRAADGWYDLMYVAPERLCDPSFLAFASQVRIPLIAVDEAHCVSQWGNDFRPAYRDIAGFVAALPERPRVMALTATATPRVTSDVRALLGLNDPVVEISGFDRPNLKLASFELTPKKRETWTRNYVLAHPHDTGIVYATTRKKVDQIAADLREAGVKVAAYHAGMSDKARTDSQQAFVRDDVQVMVATNAFGMGIDKSNVRYVINCGMPQTLEEYYQEAGRAGRDGEPAECYLLWSRGDIRTAHYFIETTEYPEGTTYEERRLLQEVRERLLGAMIGYAMSTSCLRARVLRYFGQWMERGPEGCGGCSVCTGETADTYLRVQRAKKAGARAAAGVQAAAGVRAAAGAAGAGTADEWGAAGAAGAAGTRDAARGRDAAGAAGVVDAQGAAAVAAAAGAQAAADVRDAAGVRAAAGAAGTRGFEDTIHDAGLQIAKERAASMGTSSSDDVAEPTKNPISDEERAEFEEELFQRLRALRKQLADDAQVPPYVIFSDRTLRAMVHQLPRTDEELLEVSGVGKTKLKRYGKEFLAELWR